VNNENVRVRGWRRMEERIMMRERTKKICK
jgi:hypothetical protein